MVPKSTSRSTYLIGVPGGHQQRAVHAGDQQLPDKRITRIAGVDPLNMADRTYPYGSIQNPGALEQIVLHQGCCVGGRILSDRGSQFGGYGFERPDAAHFADPVCAGGYATGAYGASRYNRIDVTDAVDTRLIIRHCSSETQSVNPALAYTSMVRVITQHSRLITSELTARIGGSKGARQSAGEITQLHFAARRKLPLAPPKKHAD